MTNEERETVITFDDSSPTAQIYTCNLSLIAKLERIALTNTQVYMVRRTDSDATYNLPKKMICVKNPINLSESEKKKRSERMKRFLEERKNKNV